MKQLYLIRHAKSSWSDTNLSDFDRPLNNRGLNDAPKIGTYLHQLNLHPDLIISSSANRAYTTACIIASALSYPIEQIKTDRALYLADVNTFYAVVQTIPDSVKQIILFSHNNGITDFSNTLCATKINSMPTCAVFAVKFNINSWQDINKNVGEFMFFKSPKEL